MVGGFVAATVVTLLQFLRVRDRRLLLLAAMFAFQAQALAREWYDVWRDVFQSASAPPASACCSRSRRVTRMPRRRRRRAPGRPGPPAS